MNDDQALIDSLPDEVRELIQRPERVKQETLDALGVTIAKMRDEAVKARKDSGIEQTWLECEEAYLGVDDENRAEFQHARWAKPLTMEGVLTRQRNSSNEVRATAFVKLTARYVDAGTAKVCEIALPIDGKAFTLKATPVPEMDSAKDDKTLAQAVTGMPMPGPDGQPVTVGALAANQIEKAETAAEKAATRIHDWMIEGKHAAEMRKCIFDMARLGVTVLKGPIPEMRKATKVTRDPQTKRIKIERSKKRKPAARWIDPWCFYPAPGCGEDIHNGGHCFEVDPMLEGQLLALGKDREAFFIPEAIDKVVMEGPDKCMTDSYAGQQTAATKRKQFDVWHFHGMVPRADFEAANPAQASELDRAKDQVFAIITLVNDTVIRAIQSPLDYERLPYQVAVWRRRAGHWAGVGVAEQIRTPQRVVNAATRAMLNNGGKSSGAQVVMDPNMVEPANGDHQIVGDKLWFLRKDSGADDVRKVFAAFNWPNTTAQLMQIIEYAFKLAEEHSSIPLITQGQSGDTTPDTFGGQQLQDNNANQLLRDVGFGLNDQITTPLVDHYYQWLLEDPDVPDDEKGDYQVDTSGALALIEKALQDQTILAMGGMVVNPAFGLDPKRWVEAWMRSKRLVPTDFQYSEAEAKKMAETPPPPPPVVMAAQIRAESAEKIAASHDNLLATKVQVDTDRDTAFVNSQARRDEAMAEARREETLIRKEIAELNHAAALMQYAKDERISLQEAKVRLAETTMKLNAQKEIAGMDGKGPQVANPATEPPGRAPDGQAFQR